MAMLQQVCTRREKTTLLQVNDGKLQRKQWRLARLSSPVISAAQTLVYRRAPRFAHARTACPPAPNASISCGVWKAALLFFCLKRSIQAMHTTPCMSCCRHSSSTPGTARGGGVPSRRNLAPQVACCRAVRRHWNSRPRHRRTHHVCHARILGRIPCAPRQPCPVIQPSLAHRAAGRGQSLSTSIPPRGKPTRETSKHVYHASAASFS